MFAQLGKKEFINGRAWFFRGLLFYPSRNVLGLGSAVPLKQHLTSECPDLGRAVSHRIDH
jgi:hypothetical protein